MDRIWKVCASYCWEPSHPKLNEANTEQCFASSVFDMYVYCFRSKIIFFDNNYCNCALWGQHNTNMFAVPEKGGQVIAMASWIFRTNKWQHAACLEEQRTCVCVSRCGCSQQHCHWKWDVPTCLIMADWMAVSNITECTFCLQWTVLSCVVLPWREGNSEDEHLPVFHVTFPCFDQSDYSIHLQCRKYRPLNCCL